jgi:hypothetical protein
LDNKVFDIIDARCNIANYSYFSAFFHRFSPPSRTVLMSREAGKVVPVRPKMAYKGGSSIDSDILNLVPRWR